MERSDTSLVAACRGGDEQAWVALVERYQRLIYSIPLRAGLDESRSSEIFQTVFARLVEKLDTLEQPDRLQAWLVTTAKRETWRVARRERSLEAASSPDVEWEASQPIEDGALLPDEVVQRLEEQHTVRRALMQLDERCQRLLRLLFYEAAVPSYAEIAADLGTTEGSIGPTRIRCLKKLRITLDQMGF